MQASLPSVWDDAGHNIHTYMRCLVGTFKHTYIRSTIINNFHPPHPYGCPGDSGNDFVKSSLLNRRICQMIDEQSDKVSVMSWHCMHIQLSLATNLANQDWSGFGFSATPANPKSNPAKAGEGVGWGRRDGDHPSASLSPWLVSKDNHRTPY
ncbi:uncharacterized protein CIMG_06585 [Coccidioides immitis RS]|uniref:Uncharacterized protein n=3 Tax=Coccidioides immitis TaxID=5501 RepID=J3K8G2_COCIM|nr:uncharacterized protein CIMG_06585 [Coccidioides immitis RS]EAS31106.3 hypothetical protein CIMG_06585 [Coccidioides immitis RS]KMP03715.1 hypothetical protein CIRG_03407 [Coccidioides immitis RMSCC 2394]KMU83214.1 hypothetical protein CIHG_00996 [Coccidioides immitis H538.4]